MKKYVKPELFYEHFELSQQIAACTFDGTGDGPFVGIHPEFDVEMAVFTAKPPCNDIFESGCYHNSVTSDIGIFNS